MKIESQAESKLFKVGEPFSVDTDGNTEPSTLENSNEACVETRQRVCIKCGNVITKKRKGLKYCSIKCRNAYLSYAYCVRHKKFEAVGVGSGGNQEGKRNHQYKTGIGTYRKKAFSERKHQCERCGSKERLEVHHKDENRNNNELHNLEILCKKCHKKHHTIRDSLGKYTKV